METAPRKVSAAFFGFRGTAIMMTNGLPVDFAIAPADTDDREVLRLLAERGRYPILLGDKGYISAATSAGTLRNPRHRFIPDAPPKSETTVS